MMDRGQPFRTVHPEAHLEFRGSFSGREPDCLFFNPDGEHRGLISAAYVFGLDSRNDGRAASPVDFDGDGDLDVVVLGLQGVRVYENPSPPRRFARVRLHASASQHHALGARVELRALGVTHRDHVRITEGFQTQVPLDLHFGLGSATSIEALTVHWPGGASQTFADLPVDRLLLVREGSDVVEARELPRWPDETRPRTPPAASPALQAELVGGGRERLAPEGRIAVVNFWAPWCAPCREELPELARVSREWSSDVAFAGVSVEVEDRSAVRAAIEALGLPYAQLLANRELMEGFFGDSEEVPLPSTFVFGADGALERVFRHALRAGELEAALEAISSDELQVADAAALAIRAMRRRDYAKAVEYYEQLVEAWPEKARYPFLLGAALYELGRPEAAAAALERALGLDPGMGPAHHLLGVLRFSAGRAEDAFQSFRAAVEALGDAPDSLFYLGVTAADTGRGEEALRALERCIALQPDAPAAWTVKGRLHARAGDVDLARRCLTRALELEPANDATRRELDALGVAEPQTH